MDGYTYAVGSQEERCFITLNYVEDFSEKNLAYQTSDWKQWIWWTNQEHWTYQWGIDMDFDVCAWPGRNLHDLCMAGFFTSVFWRDWCIMCCASRKSVQHIDIQMRMNILESFNTDSITKSNDLIGRCLVASLY